MPNPPNLVFNPTADTRKLRKCYEEVIGYKKNAAKNAPQKRVAKLVEEQTDRDRIQNATTENWHLRNNCYKYIKRRYTCAIPRAHAKGCANTCPHHTR